MYEHEHEHHNGHVHSHESPSTFDSIEQAEALMRYMLDHNRHHAEELHELCHKLEAGGKGEAANLIGEAFDRYGEGNEFLAQALEALKG